MKRIKQTKPPGSTKSNRYGVSGVKYILPRHISEFFGKLHKPKPFKRRETEPTGHCKNVNCGKKLPELTATLRRYNSKYCNNKCCTNYRAWLKRQRLKVGD